MPELPEVETIVRQLAPHVEGRALEEVEVLDRRWCRPADPAAVAGALQGRTIDRLSRRGKYLVWEASGNLFLLLHLRMTGTLLLDPITRPAHLRARLALDDGHWLAYCDPRRFGTAELARGTAELEDFFAVRLGVEPLGPHFTERHLRALARGVRAPVKAFLLDQRRIAGVGNIYADEALFRARIHPLRRTGALTTGQLASLHEAIVDSLAAGITAGGATIDDYRDVTGARGAFQDEFLVHRRAGRPCPRCGGTVVKLVAVGRGTYVCERCQRRPRRLPGPVRRRAAR